MDYDGDGDLDLLTGSYTGEVYLFERGDDGAFAQCRYLLDRDGAVLTVGGSSVTIEAHDMDGDGDLDLLVGTRESGVRIIDNVGARREPVWAPQPRELSTASGRPITGSNAHFADWDGDGVRDLLVGAEYGGVGWHRNVGSDAGPVYAEAVVLVPKGAVGKPVAEGEAPPLPGSRTKVHVGDWNGDGALDLLVGDVTWQSYELPPLTAEQVAEQEALRPEYERARAEQKAMFDEYNRTRRPIPEELEQRFTAVNERVRPILVAWSAFRRERHNTHGWVWLFPGQVAAAEVAAGGAAGAPGKAELHRAGPTALAVDVAPVAGKPGTFVLTAEVRIDDGWHIYAEAPEGYTATAADLELPAGVERVAPWQVMNEAHAAGDGSAATWFVDRAVFRCEVAAAGVDARSLTVTVVLQACDAAMCMPPVELRRVVQLPHR